MTVASSLQANLESPQIVIDLPTSGVEPSGPPFRMVYWSGQITDGGANSPYYDHVVHLGWNLAPGAARAVSNEPGWHIGFESKFRNSSAEPFGCEFHMELVSLSDELKRAIGIWAAHDGSRIDWSMSASNFVIFSPSGVVQAALVVPQTGRSSWNLKNVAFVAEFNNAAVFYQMNGAGNSFLPLPYYDSNNVLQMLGPITVNSAVDPSTLAVMKTNAVMSNLASLWLVSGNAVSGQVWGFRHFLDSTGEAANLIENNNTTSATAHAVLDVRVAGPGSGKPFVRWRVEGGGSTWCMGIDNSDNDKLKISKSGEVGISNILVSDGATIDFVVPPKLPSYTVSTLPTASTAGAGACAFATDLAGATYTYGVAAAGRGSRRGKVFSDGSAWREG